MGLNSTIAIPEEVIIGKIYLIRGNQVMLSHDLAELYEVETKVLNLQVKRNTGKFPERYMFQLTKAEFERLRSQNVTFKNWRIKYLPYAFTEHGILMLASVLNSERANQINFLIIDTFIKLRDILSIHKDVLHQLEHVKNKLSEHDNRIMVILKYLKEIENARQDENNQRNRRKIGYKHE